MKNKDDQDPPFPSAPPLAVPVPISSWDTGITAAGGSGSGDTKEACAMYWKNPAPEMVGRAKKKQIVGGLLFIEASEPKGKFIVPKSYNAISVLNEFKIDLSYADFVHPITTIHSVGTLGELKIIVPRGVLIETSGLGVLGEFKGTDQNISATSEGPLIRVQGVSVLASVNVKVNKDVPPVRIIA
uniref:Cell wall-active antibiotics response LiaF-like C-terminal domain-containing protein n=1 Tax=Corethron hystrix TaxID=216773 RepID=A0A7S1B9K8_9STRA|mmetsp:Transcript_18449/g.42239  ORF Transcript_18449/g.42239 Transcript_18449/m.42239 type:complete len:185 (+) Transcript_18449:81-635(+)